MAIAKIWSYFGAQSETNDLPLPQSPYVARQQITTGPAPVSSAPQPALCNLMQVEVTVPTRVRVVPPGETIDADTNDLPMWLSPYTNYYYVPPGSTISLLEE